MSVKLDDNRITWQWSTLLLYFGKNCTLSMFTDWWKTSSGFRRKIVDTTMKASTMICRYAGSTILLNICSTSREKLSSCIVMSDRVGCWNGKVLETLVHAKETRKNEGTVNRNKAFCVVVNYLTVGKVHMKVKVTLHLVWSTCHPDYFKLRTTLSWRHFYTYSWCTGGTD